MDVEHPEYKEARIRQFLSRIRIYHAIDYRSQLLATTALWHPDWVRKIAAPRALIRQIEAKEAQAKAQRMAAA